jgi:NAD(P)H dehydrogenase (quinone)
MKYLVVYCHPNPKSFNHAVKETFVEKIKNEGNEVKERDLYDMGFDPVLKGEDFVAMQGGNIPEDIKAEQEHVQWADVIAFIHPIWWFQMPAMLKGYIDRVFLPGFAYALEGNEIKGLLPGKKIIILNTTGGPEERYAQEGYGECLKKIFSSGIFGLCGMEVILHEFFYAVPFVTDEDRKKMLEELKTMVHLKGE